MKWDVKHDRAKKVINRFLENSDYWQESEDLAEGLTEEDKEQVNEELRIMIASIVKRYKLDVMLPKQESPEVKTEEQGPEQKEDPEVKVEKTAEQEVEKPKRGRRPAGDKKTADRKPRVKKVKEGEQ